MVNSLQQFVDTFEALGDPNAIYEYVLDFGSNISYDKQATDNDGLFTNKDASTLSG